MNDDTLLDKQHFIEAVGLFFEQSGMTRMAGRILGWLLICDPPEQTAAELQAALQASAGAISAATRYLTHLNLIERISLPGKRRDHYRIRAGMWADIMRSRVGTLTAFRRLADQGLALIDNKPPALRARLEEARSLYAFFERELPLLMQKWHEEQAQKQP